MAEISKKDLTEALKEMATRNDIYGLGKKIDKVQKDIISIHSDLIEHDKRNEKMLEHLAENQRISERLERIRENIKTKLGVEV